MPARNLILLHGALGSNAQFDELSALLGRAYNVFAFNFSGHGGLTVEAPYSIDLFVRDTLAFMDGHHLKSANFFGYSMGGYVALNLALHHPDRCGKIMTLGTKFLWNPEAAAKEVRMMNPDVIEQKVPAFATTLAERHFPQDWKTIMRLTAAMMTDLGNGSALTTQAFNAIQHEVLVAIGSNDHMVSVEESRQTADALPNGHLQIIEGFRHPLEAVDMPTLATLITAYFRSPT